MWTKLPLLVQWCKRGIYVTSQCITIYNYLCNQCLSPLTLSVTCDRPVDFSGYSVSSIKKSDHHHIADILLKVALNTILKFNVFLPILVASGLLPTCWSMVGVISAVAYGGLRVVDTSRKRPPALRNKCKVLNYTI